jgi:hypothetical protein
MPTATLPGLVPDPWQAQGNVAAMLLEMQAGSWVMGGRKWAPPKGLDGCLRFSATCCG